MNPRKILSSEPELTLPHRPPFVWVTRLLSRDDAGTQGEVELDVREDLDVLRGHFPGNPIFPGVLQIEAAAQACCWMHLGVLAPTMSLPEVRFVSVDKYKFKRPVVPPCTLLIRGHEIQRRGSLYYWGIEILRQDEVVSGGNFWLKLVKPPEPLAQGSESKA